MTLFFVFKRDFKEKVLFFALILLLKRDKRLASKIFVKLNVYNFYQSVCKIKPASNFQK
jgi:hypothetical protein